MGENLETKEKEIIKKAFTRRKKPDCLKYFFEVILAIVLTYVCFLDYKYTKSLESFVILIPMAALLLAEILTPSRLK